MKKTSELQTIVQDPYPYIDHPWFVLSPTLVKLFMQSGERIGILETKLHRTLVAFDCFLHINGVESLFKQSISTRHKYFINLVEGFIGAIYTSSFIAMSHKVRYTTVRAFRSILIDLRTELNVPICDVDNSARFEESSSKLLDIRISTSVKQQTPFILKCVSKYEALPPFDGEALYLWRGWPVTNLVGATTWLRLYPMYKRLGRDFTEACYLQCKRYLEGRRTKRVPALTALARFIGEYPGELKVSDFQSPAFITQFWPKFLIFYITTGDDEGSSLPSLNISWRTEFIYFANHFLVASGLFAEGYSPIPAPPATPQGKNGRTNIRRTNDGIEVHAKLLVHIPLQANDTEAMKILFHQLQENVDLVLQWARSASQDIWERCKRRKEEAKVGTPRERIQPEKMRFGTGWLIHHENPDRFINACATYELHGHLTSHDEVITLLYPAPLAKSAHYLGLPTIGSLLPHLTLLVAAHPAITPSFLENLELYDKNGKDCCFVEIDGAMILRSSKGRKGPLLSWQEITLNAETAEVIRQLIEITAPLRKYLKARNDDNWRYLLLTAEKGFANPSRLGRIVTDTSMEQRVRANALSMHYFSGQPLEKCEEVAKCFSLPALRATVGVLVYLETKDAKKMAEALGHTAYDKDLLSRYLPDEILSFFQERWIRIFQTSIIVDSMKDSDYLLPASGFKNIHELDEFLSNHTFKKVPWANTEDMDAGLDGPGKVLFGLDVSILTALLSLQMAIRQANGAVNATAKYWNDITKSLVRYITSDACDRDDLRQYLKKASAHADPATMIDIICEN